MQTLGCDIERITNVDQDEPTSKLVYTFPGSLCGVPTIVGHYLIQSVPMVQGLIAIDITNGDNPVEVSRLKLADGYFSHWTGWDARTQRLVVTGDQPRLFLVKLDMTSGALTVDTAFHDADGKPGFDFADRQWPHGVVFSRQ